MPKDLFVPDHLTTDPSLQTKNFSEDSRGGGGRGNKCIEECRKNIPL